MRTQSGTFKGALSTDIHWEGWIPDTSPVAAVFLVHGLAEHIGRYRNLISRLTAAGYSVYGADLSGHGKSVGRRGYVERFRIYLDDLYTFYSMTHKVAPSAKNFLLGHSMGGLIAVNYAVDHQQDFTGLIVSAPLLKPGASISPGTIKLARMMSALAPKIGIAALDSSHISHDRAVVEAYDSDPLVFRGKISARLGSEMFTAMGALEARIPSLILPMLIMQGSDDQLVNPEGVKMLYEKASSRDKTLKIYDGFYHEIFNEPGKDQVFADLENWLKAHLFT